MSHHLIHKSSVVTSQLRSDIPEFNVGMVITVNYRIKEGNKERIQAFKGIVIDRHAGSGIDATFTVLRVSAGGIKVERTFPLHSPMIESIVIDSPLVRARKAKLSYLHNLKDPIKSVRTRASKPIKQSI